MVSPSSEHVTILLSLYDGERWLGPLLDSVQRQSHSDWTLLVRDDGSSDQGPTVVSAHARDDKRIVLLDDDGLGNLGPARSFMTLLAKVTDDGFDDGYFAFCDQDDLWLPHKLAWSLDAITSDQSISLVVTDAEITDADGRLVAASALAARGVRSPITLGRLLVNNAAIGATMVGTPDLARAVVSLSRGREVLMHDWWCALVAAYAGSVRVVPSPTVRWRRHSGTVTGVAPDTMRGRMRRRLEYLAWSIEAARLLRDSPLVPVDAAAARQASVLASVDPEHPSLRRLATAMGAGVRAWTRRGQTGLMVAVLGRRWAK